MCNLATQIQGIDHEEGFGGWGREVISNEFFYWRFRVVSNIMYESGAGGYIL